MNKEENKTPVDNAVNESDSVAYEGEEAGVFSR